VFLTVAYALDRHDVRPLVAGVWRRVSGVARRGKPVRPDGPARGEGEEP
jgi:hypothetical protein